MKDLDKWTQESTEKVLKIYGGAEVGFIFLPPKGGGNNLTRLMRKNTLDRRILKCYRKHVVYKNHFTVKLQEDSNTLA